VAKASIAGIITTMTAFTVYINSALPTFQERGIKGVR